MTQRKRILVTGATGKQGGAVALSLLGRGHAVSAVTRRPDSPAAADLAKAGAEIVVGDFTDRASLTAVMQGMDAVFVMSTSFEVGPEAETAQGIAAIEAAEEGGVGHVIYSSVASADRNTGVPHFESKFAVEQRLRESRLDWTVVAPVAFMDFLAPHFVDGLRAGELRFGLPAERVVQYVAVADIGAVVAEVVERREAMSGRRIELAGDERDGEAVAAVLARFSGRDIRYVPLPPDVFRPANEDLALMLEWLDKVGYDVDRKALREMFPNMRWHSLEDWAAAQDWTTLATAT